jgi:hypothetical protein
MPGVYRQTAPPRRSSRQFNPALFASGGVRSAAVSATLAVLASAVTARSLLKANSNRTLGSLAGVAALSTSGARAASVARTLAGLGRSILVETAVWTSWQPVEVIVCPGAIWDTGASIWDGADDVYDNDGAIWDPTSPFGPQVPPASGGWTPASPLAAIWAEPLR